MSSLSIIGQIANERPREPTRPLRTSMGEPCTPKQLANSSQTVHVHFTQGPGAVAQIRDSSLITGRGGAQKVEGDKVFPNEKGWGVLRSPLLQGLHWQCNSSFPTKILFHSPISKVLKTWDSLQACNNLSFVVTLLYSL